MKSLLLVFVFAICSTQAYDHISVTNRLRYRLNDEGEVFDAYRSSSWDIFIEASVISFAENGLLVESEKLGTIFVEGMSGKGLVDNSLVSFLASPAGMYEYTSVLGARKRIRKYRYGKVPSQTEVDAYLAAEEKREREWQDREIARKQEAERQRALQAQAAAQSKRDEMTPRVVANQKKRAEAGYELAQYDLAVRYIEGNGVAKNRELAIHWLKSACTNGSSQASNKLATLQ